MITVYSDDWNQQRAGRRSIDTMRQIPVAQLRLTLKSNHWHLYWMRKFDAWVALLAAGRRAQVQPQSQS